MAQKPVCAVHTMAENFNNQVEAYEKARPSYPKSLVDLVVAQNNLKEDSRVLDLAAGNGKLTRVLESYKFNLSAVEPAEGMRKGFSKVLPHIPIHEGTATSIPFGDHEFDAIFIGQEHLAFHWFANLEALKEFHRVLKKGGSLILLWNMDDIRVPWVNHLHELFVQYEAGAPQYRHGKWRLPFEDPITSQLFSPLQEAHDKNDIVADLNLIWLRVLSRSYISALDKETQDKVRDQIFEYLRKTVPEFDPTKGGKDENSVICPYVTDAFWCTAL